MRLFIAVCFTPEFAGGVARMQDELREAGVRGRYAAPESLHLTLTFIGESTPEQFERAVKALKAVPFRPFALSLSGLGNFGETIWAGVDIDPAVTDYVARLRKSLDDFNLGYDVREFRPHITLVRRAQGHFPREIEVPRVKMNVTRISLMRTEFQRGRAVYRELYAKYADR